MLQSAFAAAEDPALPVGSCSRDSKNDFQNVVGILNDVGIQPPQVAEFHSSPRSPRVAPSFVPNPKFQPKARPQPTKRKKRGR